MQKWIAWWTSSGDLPVLVVRDGPVFNVSQRTRAIDRHVDHCGQIRLMSEIDQIVIKSQKSHMPSLPRRRESRSYCSYWMSATVAPAGLRTSHRRVGLQFIPYFVRGRNDGKEENQTLRFDQKFRENWVHVHGT